MASPDRWPAILLQLDADNWVRAADVAEAMGVSESTIYREVHAMVEAGIPIRGVPGHGYRLRDEYLLSPLRFTVDEAVMIVVGSARAVKGAGGRYGAAARSARGRIQRILPDDVDAEVQSVQRSVPLPRSSLFRQPRPDSLLPTIAEAVTDEQTLAIALASGEGATTTRTVDPYGLTRKGVTWFVVGRDRESNRVVQHDLQAIQDVWPVDETFQRPASYGTGAARRQVERGQQVRVLFSKEAAASGQIEPVLDVVEREDRPDGRLVVTLQIDDHSDVIPTVLSWGRHAKVLEPRALRDRLAAEARATADQYESVPSLLD